LKEIELELKKNWIERNWIGIGKKVNWNWKNWIVLNPGQCASVEVSTVLLTSVGGDHSLTIYMTIVML